uniref:NADH-ubiquinone oxidoreductase chain 4L n=1 Tax=Gastrallus laevigatus TaxID=1586484 RepID=A0A343C2Z3_9COLE|nr:NADH dehydrogenase subunit 4L [Gastrallus laevigatus]
MFIIMYFSGVLSFLINRKHLLFILLSLEFIVISLYLGLSYLMLDFVYESFFLMIYLTLMVCESALGLSILVSMIRSFGNDYFETFNLLW